MRRIQDEICLYFFSHRFFNIGTIYLNVHPNILVIICKVRRDKAQMTYLSYWIAEYKPRFKDVYFVSATFNRGIK